ncbi:MAG: integrase arm-type DNA-binding domain-containing protein [Rhodobacteraceae bacterium]|nr:integrase arm-type DNA-binding domain-containing protein [Paracoccaceae bacterium]
MARTKNKLTAVAVKKAPPGILQDGGGLMLHKAEASGRWVYRYSIAGRRRDMGLGTLADVSLSDARKARDRWASVLASGKDPISERERERQEVAAELGKDDPLFEDWAMVVFEARKSQLRGEGKRGMWLSPLQNHIFPKIGKRRISTLHQADIADALRPIWRKKFDTAEKALQRTHIIFRHAKLAGLDVDPFVVEAAKHILGEVRQPKRHLPSTPWQKIPELYTALAGDSAGRLCLRWLILTAVRGESGRGARFSEIDGDVWTVPGERMKGAEGRLEDFRVPLSAAALELLEEIKARKTGDLMFCSYRTNFISEVSLLKVLNGMGEVGRPHGFRSSFRSWVQDNEAASYEVAETALAHKVGNKIERTYARSDLLEPRRVLMNAWGQFVTGAAAQNVLPLRRGGH